MLISFVIPAYNSSKTIARTLNSIYKVHSLVNWEIETIIVDDGSEDKDAILKASTSYKNLKILSHDINSGMCAARNTGISASLGDIVTILDSDDELVQDWPLVLAEILKAWPSDANICYAACRNSAGLVTALQPAYQGYLSLYDLLNERYSGEYLPIFHGDYVRRSLYIDLGLRKSCGIVSYINFAQDGPFWISNRVLRIYNDSRKGSISHDWTSPHKARETVKCYDYLFKHYAYLYRTHAPQVYRTKHLRLAIYRRLAGVRGVWRALKIGFSFSVLTDFIGTLCILALGPRVGAIIIKKMKEIGIIRRYG